MGFYLIEIFKLELFLDGVSVLSFLPARPQQGLQLRSTLLLTQFHLLGVRSLSDGGSVVRLTRFFFHLRYITGRFTALLVTKAIPQVLVVETTARAKSRQVHSGRRGARLKTSFVQGFLKTVILRRAQVVPDSVRSDSTHLTLRLIGK